MSNNLSPNNSAIRIPQSEFNFSHVLLVDDSPVIIGMLERFMSSLGYSYASAANGLEAVEMLRNQDFDLIITDIEMPGMDGIELLQHLHNTYPDTSSIAITGHSEKYSFLDVIHAGATDFLSKPFQKEELEAKIGRICRERTAIMAYQHEIKTNKIINDLLQISLAEVEFEDIFPEFMRHFSSLSWLGLEPKGAVFLADNETHSLELMAEHNFDKSQLTTCANVPFGTCLCGRAAQNGEIVFADCLDARHDKTYEGIHDHGHYCVPMRTAAGKLLGVFTLYIKSGTKRLRHVEKTLLSVAETAAVVIQYHLFRRKILKDEKKFEMVLESSPDAILFIDGEGGILLANQQLERLFGYQRQELLSKKVEILIPERFADRHSMYRTGFFKDPKSGPMSHNLDNLWGLRKDGSEFAIEVSLNPVQTEEGNFAIASIRDVTERRQLQLELTAHQEHLEELVAVRSRELQESEAQMRAITSSAQSAIIMIDNEGLVLFWNEAAKRCFGWGADEIINKPIHDFIIPTKFINAHLRGLKSFIETGRGKNIGKVVKVSGMRKNGEEFPLEMALSAVNMQNKWHAIAIITDITNRKEFERELNRKVDDLEKFNRLAVKRELKMIDLKEEINSLLVRLGDKEHYKIVKQ